MSCKRAKSQKSKTYSGQDSLSSPTHLEFIVAKQAVFIRCIVKSDYGYFCIEIIAYILSLILYTLHVSFE